MKHVLDLSDDHASFIDYVTILSHHIQQHHERSDLSNLVLYHLANNLSFGLKKAAYFVDNPDFDHCVGVAGFCEQECSLDGGDVWSKPEHFGSLLQKTKFNTLLKSNRHESFHRKGTQKQHCTELGKALGMNECSCISWNMRHGNKGIFLFELKKNLAPWQKNMLRNIVPFLGFCSL